jgi:tetratricopeptide (TPR) repeat protein
MSRIEQRLDILINVQDQNAERLRRPISTLKELLNAQASLDRQRQRSRDALASLLRLEQAFNTELQAGARREIELMRVGRLQVQVQQERERRVRQALLSSAELAASQGNLARAEERYNAALRLTNPSLQESARIRQRILGLATQQARAQQAAATQAVQLAVSQARVATATGNHAQALTILNRALAAGNLNTAQQARLTNALAAAHRAQGVAANQAARATAQQARAQQQSGAATTNQISLFSRLTRTLSAAVLIGFSLRTVFRSIDRLVISPVVDLGKNVAATTDEFRRMEASLVGITGSARAARDLTREIAESARGLPVTKLEALQGIRGLAFTPGTAGAIATPGEGRGPAIESLLRTLTGLATIDPEQGIKGAQFAVREALSGEFRSLRFRFEISPDAVAASIGKSLEDLKADPRLTIEALSKFVDTFVGQDAVNAFNRLLSTQANRLRGAFQEFLNLVGDQGIYDRLVSLVGGLADALSGASRGGQAALLGGATIVSQSLDRFLDNVLSAVGATIFSLTGKNIDLNKAIKEGDVAKLGEAVGAIIEQLSKLASFFVLLIPDIVSLIGALTFTPSTPGKIEDALDDLALTINNTTDRIKANQDALSLFKASLSALREGDFQGADDLAQQANARLGRTGLFGGPVGGLRDIGSSLSLGPESDLLSQIGSVQDSIEKLDRSLKDSEGETARLRVRLQILETLTPAAARPPSSSELISARVGEAIKPLGLIGGRFDQSLRSLPSLDEDRITLERNIAVLLRDVKSIYDPADPTSLTSLIASSDEEIARFQEEIAALLSDQGTGEAVRQREEAIRRIREAQQIQRKFVSDRTLQGLLGIINQSQGFISQRADTVRAPQAADILSLISGQNFRASLGFGGSESLVSRQARGTIDAAGLNQSRLLDPALLSTILALINDVGDALGRIEPGTVKGAKAVAILADTMADAFGEERARSVQELSKAVDDASRIKFEIRIDEIDAAIEKLRELQREAEYAADIIKQQFAELGASVSDTLRTSFVDVLLDVLNEGAANVQDIVRSMLISIQRAVLDSIINILVIRSIINPILNAGFGLTGTPGALPTLGRTGFPIDGRRVVPFRTGGIVDSPEMFPLAGGRVGVRGEDGPEAVLPLGRGSDGKLGVKGIGSLSQSKVVQVTMHISTPNADSFRKSEKQILRGMQRATREF